MKVQHKVIVVTGGGSGMGRALVLNLLSKEARVVAIDINEINLQETAVLAAEKKIHRALLWWTSPIKFLSNPCIIKYLPNMAVLME